MGESQIANLISDSSFGHNLCFKYLNGSCEPNLDIYIEELSNDIRNTSIQWVLTIVIIFWKFKNPFETLTPTMGIHLGVWGFTPSHSLHSWSTRCDSRVSLLAHNLATSCFMIPHFISNDLVGLWFLVASLRLL
jgi:hypothetical protein